MKRITVFFKGTPGDAKDKACRAIFEKFDADFYGCGTFLPDARDVEYAVREEDLTAVVKALEAAGFDDYDVGDLEEEDEEE